MSEVNDQKSEQFTKKDKILMGSVVALVVVAFIGLVTTMIDAGDGEAAATLVFLVVLGTFNGLVFYWLYRRAQKK